MSAWTLWLEARALVHRGLHQIPVVKMILSIAAAYSAFAHACGGA